MKKLFTKILTSKSFKVTAGTILTTGAYFYNQEKINKYYKNFQSSNYNNRVLRCESDVDARYAKEELKNMEKDINSKFEKENEESKEMPDLPFEMMDDEQMSKLQELMENPDLDPEAYQEIMSNQINNTPPPFKTFNQAFKCHSDDDTWNGLKLNAEYNPIMNFRFEFEGTLDPITNTKGAKYSFVSMNPSKTDPNKALVIVGRSDPVHMHSLQGHINFSQKDRLSLVAGYQKNDQNQAMYETEYNKTLDRANFSAKIGNMGSSLSCAVNAWKNTHVGVETNLNPKSGEIMYSYGLNCKPYKKFGFSVMYLSYVPMFSLDFLFLVSNYKFIFSSFCKRPIKTIKPIFLFLKITIL